MLHHFDADMATRYGIVEAVLINHLQFWITKNRADSRHFHDGRTWTYSSIKALQVLFPYATAKQIRNAIETLTENGILISGNYNENQYDRTAWYAFADESAFLPSESGGSQKGQMHLPHRANGSAPQGKSLKGADDVPDNIYSAHLAKSDGSQAHVEKPESVEEDTWIEFLEVRKAKRAPLTPKALAGIEREAEKAGISLEHALTVCIERGWQSFRAEWRWGTKEDTEDMVTGDSGFAFPIRPPSPEVLAIMDEYYETHSGTSS